MRRRRKRRRRRRRSPREAGARPRGKGTEQSTRGRNGMHPRSELEKLKTHPHPPRRHPVEPLQRIRERGVVRRGLDRARELHGLGRVVEQREGNADFLSRRSERRRRGRRKLFLDFLAAPLARDLGAAPSPVRRVVSSGGRRRRGRFCFCFCCRDGRSSLRGPGPLPPGSGARRRREGGARHGDGVGTAGANKSCAGSKERRAHDAGARKRHRRR